MTLPEEAAKAPRILSECVIRFVFVESPGFAEMDGVRFWLNKSSLAIGRSLCLGRIDDFGFVLRREYEHVGQQHGPSPLCSTHCKDSKGEREIAMHKAAALAESMDEGCLSRHPISICRQGNLRTMRGQSGATTKLPRSLAALIMQYRMAAGDLIVSYMSISTERRAARCTNQQSTIGNRWLAMDTNQHPIAITGAASIRIRNPSCFQLIVLPRDLALDIERRKAADDDE